MDHALTTKPKAYKSIFYQKSAIILMTKLVLVYLGKSLFSSLSRGLHTTSGGNYQVWRILGLKTDNLSTTMSRLNWCVCIIYIKWPFAEIFNLFKFYLHDDECNKLYQICMARVCLLVSFSINLLTKVIALLFSFTTLWTRDSHGTIWWVWRMACQSNSTRLLEGGA